MTYTEQQNRLTAVIYRYSDLSLVLSVTAILESITNLDQSVTQRKDPFDLDMLIDLIQP